jgi:hypothetical protein
VSLIFVAINHKKGEFFGTPNPICGFWFIDDDAYKELMMFHEIFSYISI